MTARTTSGNRGRATAARAPARLSKATSRTGKPKLSRAEKSEITRNALFQAAAKVVGERGYDGAMIATITARASVANGTFYNYFETRQALFDQLLPHLGRQMLDFIKLRSADARSAREREERAFRAFFDFMLEYPEFYRILYEAEVFAPRAFAEHMNLVTKGYMRVLNRARDAGEIKRFSAEDTEAIAFILMAARYYLCMRFARPRGKSVALPEWVTKVYLKLIDGGLYG
ncbi:MAG: TetR/AcrR family transcriptional regulator [Nevskia sp.]|nr:TetR/AcrR family transcriptional regulator [Nevskia sp.]